MQFNNRSSRLSISSSNPTEPDTNPSIASFSDQQAMGFTTVEAGSLLPIDSQRVSSAVADCVTIDQDLREPSPKKVLPFSLNKNPINKKSQCSGLMLTDISLKEQDLDICLQSPCYKDGSSTLWSKIQNQYTYEDDLYTLSQPGVSNWVDMGSLIDRALSQPKHQGQKLRFILNEYQLTCDVKPDAAFFEKTKALLSQATEGTQCEVILRGDPLDPPKAWIIDADQAQELTLSQLSNPNQFDQTLRQLSLKDQCLYQAFINAAEQLLDNQSQTASLKEGIEDKMGANPANKKLPLSRLLEKATENFNLNAQHDWLIDTETQRSKIRRLLQGLSNKLSNICAQQGLSLTPLDFILAQTHRSKGGVYSVGGGQTLTLLQLVIRAIDRGLLPLDLRLEGDNRSTVQEGRIINTAVAEVVEQNQRRSHLGPDLFLVDEHQSLIYLRPDAQRLNRIEHSQPQWLFLNVPSKALPEVFDTAMLQLLKDLTLSPSLIISAKSFIPANGGVDVPATTLSKKLRQTKPGLEKQLIVMGGYFAAPWIVLRKPVHFVVAGEDQERVQSLGQLISTQPNKDNMKVDLRFGVSDQLFGTAIMGALKNQAAYCFARELVEEAFQAIASGHESTQLLEHLNQWSTQRTSQLITQAEESVSLLTSRENGSNQGALAISAIKDFVSAEGVRADFERCMINPVSHNFVEFISSVYELIQGTEPTSMNEPIKRLLAEKVVNEGSHFGSRNSRDGVIDQALFLACRAQRCLESFRAFRQAWTPKSWLEKTTEGRNGIYPIMKHLLDNHRQVPQLILNAARFYAQSDAKLKTLMSKLEIDK